PTEDFPDCRTFLTGDQEAGAGGGLMARQAPEQVGLVSTFGVESVDDAIARVEELGGQVVMPKQAVPGMGWLAHFLDTEGNLFAVWQSDESAARGHVSGAVQLDASGNV
ncbi:MAG: hypothetical protein PVG25_13665, partial [Anaerolineae bacterium]